MLYIASDVTKDLVTDENAEKYDVLPKKAPLFTAAMLIAIGKNFRIAGENSILHFNELYRS